MEENNQNSVQNCKQLNGELGAASQPTLYLKRLATCVFAARGLRLLRRWPGGDEKRGQTPGSPVRDYAKGPDQSFHVRTRS